MTRATVLLRPLRGALWALGLLACAGGALASLAAPSPGPAALWFDGPRPSALAAEAVSLLGDAASHGLAPGDYGAEALRLAVTQARAASLAPEAAAHLAGRLTQAMERYLVELHHGRIDPRRIHHDFAAPRGDAFDAAAVLQSALAAGRLAESVRAAAPPLPLYTHLRSALAQYRGLVDHPAWRGALPPTGRKLEPGQAYSGAARLGARLRALGDFDPGAPAPTAYEGALVDAVRAFQERHGLAVDGVIGRATLAQLEVAPAARVRQIELMLERLRWTPLLQGPRMIVINIPEFVLRAYEIEEGRLRVRQEMKVIVGKAFSTRTPLLDEDLRFIEFSPYWNIPPSIARSETVPKLRSDPAFFERQGFEFVAPDGHVLSTLSAERLDAVLAGQLRIRQRPGPRNALGGIKFIFPNRSNIYLHHTPTLQLFERERRDFSHGCIRVEQPLALAQFVLERQPEWTADRIREAMERGQSSTLRLAEPVPVLIAYGTTLVKRGRIYFFDDLYGLDRALDTALRQRSPADRPPPRTP